MRVLSLCPSITETLFALGCEAAEGDGPGIVGRTKFCVEPAGVVDGLSIVGGTKDPRIDRILELAPDLVLMNEEENRREDADALAAAGIALHTSLPVDVGSTAEALRSIGEALGRRERAEELALRLEEQHARVAERAAGRGRVQFLYLIWRGPWMAAARDTYIDALLTAAGGANVLAQSDSRYPEVDLREVAEHGIDRVLLSSEPFPFKERHVAEVRAALGGSSSATIERVDGRLLSWHGASAIPGLAYAEQALRSAGEE